MNMQKIVRDPHDTLETLQHGIEAYSFLMQRESTVTGVEFAKLMTGYYDNDRVDYIAKVIASIPCSITEHFGVYSYTLTNKGDNNDNTK